MNIFNGRLIGDGSRLAVTIGDTRLSLGSVKCGVPGDEVLVGIRPEHLLLGEGANQVSGAVDLIEPTGSDLYADDLAAFIKSFDAGPVHLIGWSMGGGVVHTTSLKYPELVRSAYLFEGVANITKSPEAAVEAKELAAPIFGPVVAAFKNDDHAGALRALLDGVGGKVGIYDGLPEQSQKFYNSKATALNEYLTRNETIEYTCDEVRDSEVPTTLVMGSETIEYFQIVVFEQSLDCFGEERVTHIDGATHLWPGGAVEEFSASVTDFALKY